MDYKDYDKMRDIMSYETTMLSAYHKFGCISVRETYWTVRDRLGRNHGLLRQLYWRDFYHQIMAHYPTVLGAPMRPQYRRLKWSRSKIAWQQWTTGRTGIPIVDAAMRQLNQTGFMHNRGRMIVSNFLIKILRIDWQRGEKYFAQHLVDYDVAVNNGSWQWSASTGTDSQPYYRIFNPWRQAERYDRDCVYIRRWIPELEDVPVKDILRWETEHVKYPDIYVRPMVTDIAEIAKKTVRDYSRLG
jgi:deoxyribodipyrimidine photo-lyase